ncbi:MAG TPA: NAD(P)H-binding protein, partial [Candidatus Manganitrophaceae bacterium]|nr:NAD(P)H-binding protein [Candidatus Manganitrophaceae bacterium]
MPSEPWMIYGAYGYTGTLVAEESVRRGHRPVLAGRSADRLAALAKRLELEYRATSLQDEEALSRALAGFKLVF